jgi:hypothetical protein
MPIVIANDPVGAYMQLQNQQQLARQQQRQAELNQRGKQEQFEDEMAEYRAQQGEEGQRGRGQGAVEPNQQTGAMTPLQSAQLRQLDSAHSNGLINDDDYELAQQAVQFGDKGFNPFAERFNQSGANDRFQQTQQRLAANQQNSQQWQSFRAQVAQAQNAMQQARQMMEVARNAHTAFSPEYQAASQQYQAAAERLNGVYGTMPAGVPGSPDGDAQQPPGGMPFSQPEAANGIGMSPQGSSTQNPWQGQGPNVRITPGGGSSPMQRGGGAPMQTNPSAGTGQVVTPAGSPGMSGSPATQGTARPMPRSQLKGYIQKALQRGARGSGVAQAARQLAQGDGFDPDNIVDDQPNGVGQGDYTPPPVRRAAPPANQGQADNQGAMSSLLY